MQWDPERSLRGRKPEEDSIQVGISRHLIARYAEEWTVEIRDLTATVNKIRRLRDKGRIKEARRLLPKQRVFPVEADIRARLSIDP